MSRICISFYNGLYNENDKNIMPIWYETFLGGIKKYGNTLLIFQIKEFGKDHGEIDEETKVKILEFNPELYISFNNVFYDMSFLEDRCPIVIYEADAPIYWSNKARLKKPNSYRYAVYGSSEVEQLRRVYGIDRNQIFIVKPYTEIHADPDMNQDVNISFIGTRYVASRDIEIGNLAFEPFEVKKSYMDCLRYVIENPYSTNEEVITENGVTSEKVKKMIDVPEMLMMLSADRRVRILSSVVDLGMELYGTTSWMERYHFDVRINMAYVDKKVYSLAHNSEIYNRSRIGINISHMQAKDCFSWRVLDTMASNACLVSDGWSGVKNYFPNMGIPIYSDEHEARDICKALLADDEKRKEIVEQCHAVIEKEYRFKNLLEQLEEVTGLQLS